MIYQVQWVHSSDLKGSELSESHSYGRDRHKHKRGVKHLDEGGSSLANVEVTAGGSTMSILACSR